LAYNLPIEPINLNRLAKGTLRSLCSLSHRFADPAPTGFNNGWAE
jgi:hypothetical protein